MLQWPSEVFCCEDNDTHKIASVLADMFDPQEGLKMTLLLHRLTVLLKECSRLKTRFPSKSDGLGSEQLQACPRVLSIDCLAGEASNAVCLVL
eukprot:5877667-Amphidinium_carterae.1